MDDNVEKAWHVDKGIPLALVTTLVIQTFALGGWIESLVDRISYLEKETPSLRQELTTLNAAREVTNIAINSVQNDIKVVQRDISAILELSRRNENRNAKFENVPPDLPDKK